MKTKIAAITAAALLGVTAIGTPTTVATVSSSSITASAAATTAKVNISKCTVKISNTRFAYTGKAIKPSVTVRNGSTVLKNGTDYTITYSNNVNPNGINGSVVTVKGKGKYSGSKTAKFTIAIPLTNTSWVKFDDSNRQIDTDGSTRLIGYREGEQLPYGAYVECLNGKYKGRHICVGNGDYDIQYYKYVNGKWTAMKSVPTALGKYKVTYTGKGLFCSTITRKFDIVQGIIGASNIAWTGAVPTYTYDGTAKVPDVSNIKVTVHNKVLTLGKDYTVSYANNTSAGKASLIVKGKGNYRAGASKVFIISAKDIGGNEFNTKCVFTSSVGSTGITLAEKLLYNEKELKADTDYTVKYTITEDDRVRVTFIGKGNFKGTKTDYIGTATYSAD